MSGGPCKRHPPRDVRVERSGERWGRYCWRCGWWLVRPTFRIKEAVPHA